VQWRYGWRHLDPGQKATSLTDRLWQATIDTHAPTRPEDTAVNAARASRARLEQTVTQAEHARTEAYHERDAEARAREEAIARAEQAEQRVAGLEQRLDAVHAERTIIDAELRRQRIASSALTAQLATARSEVDELGTRLQQTRTRLARSDADLQTARAAVATRTALLERIGKQRDRLQSELTAERTAHALIRADLDEARAAHPAAGLRSDGATRGDTPGGETPEWGTSEGAPGRDAPDGDAPDVGTADGVPVSDGAPGGGSSTAELSPWRTPAMARARHRCYAIARTEARWRTWAPPVLAVLAVTQVLAPVFLRTSPVDAVAVATVALVVAFAVVTVVGVLPPHLYRLVAVPYRPTHSVLPGGVGVTLLTAMLVAAFEGGRRLAGIPAEHAWTREGILPVLRYGPTAPGPASGGPALTGPNVTDPGFAGSAFTSLTSPTNVGAGLMFGALLAALLVFLAVGASTIGVIVRTYRARTDPVAAVVVPAVTALGRLAVHSPADANSKQNVNEALSRLATNLATAFPNSVPVSGAPERRDVRERGVRAARAVRSWELRIVQGDPEQLHALREDLARLVSAIGNGNYTDLPTTDPETPLPRKRPWVSAAARALPVLPPLAFAAALPQQWSALAEQASGVQYLLGSVIVLWTMSGLARLIDPSARRPLSWLSRRFADALDPAPAPVPPATGPASAGPPAAGPLTAGPLAGPTAAGPASAGPAAAGPLAGPTAAGPASAEPAAAGPLADPAVAGPLADPAAARPLAAGTLAGPAVVGPAGPSPAPVPAFAGPTRPTGPSPAPVPAAPGRAATASATAGPAAPSQPPALAPGRPPAPSTAPDPTTGATTAPGPAPEAAATPGSRPERHPGSGPDTSPGPRLGTEPSHVIITGQTGDDPGITTIDITTAHT
jgi:hypothetical protein